ncbi:f96ef50d-3568-4987-8f24-0b6da4e50c8a [Thermothielavioides terrestris]|nr:f96ef50d-3568-4987-8f24-0b6da4e50c8a [Thermothielavioides terrestris]
MAGVNLVTDFTLYAMPIPVISSLQLPKKQKALLIVVFTLGIFPCAVSIYRIHTLAAAARSTDPTWDNVDAATFSFLELSVAVITVCLPTLRPVLIRGRIFASLLRSNMRSSTGPTGGRPSRATFGNARSGSNAEPSTFKSRLRPSDSTERLRPEDSRSPRGRLDHHDIEFGELDGAGSGAAAGPRRYSVSVVAGCMPESGSVPEVGAEGPGIKTTTVVSQKVSFHGGERPSDSDEEQGIGEGKLQGI